MNLRPGESLSVRVTRVIDGDGFIAVRLGWFRRQRETLEVRLHAIDAPEYDQPFGREATHRLRRIAEGKRFTLQCLGAAGPVRTRRRRALPATSQLLRQSPDGRVRHGLSLHPISAR